MSKLIIDRIDIIPTKIELNEPFVISKGPLTHASNTVVIIRTREGVFGTGEACPYRTIHGETQQGSVAAGKELAELILGKDAREIKKIIRIIDKNLAGNASIKSAFDMALYDLNAKALGIPLFRFLGGDNDKKIHTDMTVSLLEKEKMAAKALKYKDQGFPVLKIKLGDRPAKNDIARIKAVREAIGDEMPLRIDANQGWNYLEAIRVLDGIEEYNIEHCEAPVPAGDITSRRRLVETSPIPIMGDESVFDHFDAYKNLAEGAIDLINIKLGKAGGIYHSMKIAAIAQAAGVYCQVGCFSETRIGITALAHFSLAWDNIIYYDMDTPLMHSEDPVIGGMKYGSDWQVIVDESPGLGAEIDPKFLAKFDTITIK